MRLKALNHKFRYGGLYLEADPHKDQYEKGRALLQQITLRVADFYEQNHRMPRQNIRGEHLDKKMSKDEKELGNM